MAAALVGTLSVGEILSRLDDRFRLLTGGGGRNLGRQQTLLATVDWSHDLLSEPERVLLRRLSVMSGSFSLEDVEEVCVGDGIDRAEVVALLRRLVATSWVMRERGGDRAAYRLLETSRQYALDKLVTSSEAQMFRSKHAEWFTDLAETGAESMLGGPDQTRWFDRIGSELDNFRTALAWSLGDGDPALGLRLGAALSRFWEVRGHWTEGLGWLEDALAGAPDAEDGLRGRALVAASFLAFYRGQLDSARSMVTEGLAAAVRARDKATEARGLRFEAVIEQRMGDLAAAIDSATKAVELSRSLVTRPTWPSPCRSSVGCWWMTTEMKPALATRRASRWRAEQKTPSPRSTFCMRWAVCIFVRATTSGRASSTRKRWICLSRLESGGWR